MQNFKKFYRKNNRKLFICKICCIVFGSDCIVMRANANWAAAARGGWWPHTSRGDFFIFDIYTYIVHVLASKFSWILTEKKSGLYSFKTSDHCLCGTLYTKHFYDVQKWKIRILQDFRRKKLITLKKIQCISSVSGNSVLRWDPDVPLKLQDSVNATEFNGMAIEGIQTGSRCDKSGAVGEDN